MKTAKKEMMCELCEKFTTEYQEIGTTTDLLAKRQMDKCGIELLCNECCKAANN